VHLDDEYLPIDSELWVVHADDSTFGPDPLERLRAWEAEVEPIIASVLVPFVIINN